MARTDILQRDERFSWVADSATVRAARAALPNPTGTIVSDYEMRTTTDSSSRTHQGFESFADAISSGVDSFSYGAVSAEAPGGASVAGVRVSTSQHGTGVTIYAAAEETAAAMLNAIREVAPAARVRPRTVDCGISKQLRISIVDLHPQVVAAAQSLFGSGHYFQAEFEAFKSLESRVRGLVGSDKSGVDLMGHVFRADNPLIDTATDPGRSGTAQREGYLALFRGAMLAVRDPKAHMPSRDLDPRETLEYLALASLLHRRLDITETANGSVAPSSTSTPR